MKTFYLYSKIIGIILVLLSLSAPNHAKAQTTIYPPDSLMPLGFQGGDYVSPKPQDFRLLMDTTMDIDIVEVLNDSNEITAFGWFTNDSLDTGFGYSIPTSSNYDSIHALYESGNAGFYDIYEQAVPVIFNADSFEYFHEAEFFHTARPWAYDEAFGTIAMMSYRTNLDIPGHNYSQLVITLRDATTMELISEHLLGRFFFAVPGHFKLLSATSFTLFSGTANGGTHLWRTDLVSSFDGISSATDLSFTMTDTAGSHTSQLRFIVDTETDSIIATDILHEYDLAWNDYDDYKGLIARNDGGFVVPMTIENDTLGKAIQFYSYDKYGTLQNSLIDNALIFTQTGTEFEKGAPTPRGYIKLNDSSNNYTRFVYEYGGKTILSVDSLGLMAFEKAVAPVSFSVEHSFQRDEFLYVLRYSGQYNTQIEIFDLNIGLEQSVASYTIGSLFTPETASSNSGAGGLCELSIYGNKLHLSFSVKGRVYNGTNNYGLYQIGNNPNHQLTVSNTTKAMFSYELELPNSPYFTEVNFDVDYEIENELYRSSHYHSDTIYVSPLTDLSAVETEVILGSSISYSMFYDTNLYDINELENITTWDFSEKPTKFIKVSNRDESIGHAGDVTHFYTLTVLHASDKDGDGIADVVETSADYDGDGVPNDEDLDSDNDGVSDAIEYADDYPGDPLNNDEDGDGIINESHVNDEDNDDIADAFDPVNNISVDEFSETELDYWSNDGTLYIQSETNLNLQVYDVSGRLIAKTHSQSHVEFSGLHTGTYILHYNYTDQSKKGVIKVVVD